MTDRPILFSAPMVRALLAGRKTQTRRIIKPQPPENVTSAGVLSRSTEGQTDEWTWLSGDPHDCDTWGVEGDFKTRFRPGDRLWVKESLKYGWIQAAWRYRADGVPLLSVSRQTLETPTRDRWPLGVCNSIHMARRVSRLTLLVDDVQVERLQDISEADAIAEGVPHALEGSEGDEVYCQKCQGFGVHGGLGQSLGVIEVDCTECATATLRYRNLWNSINGPDTWDANPWIVAVTFRVVRENIDRIAG